MSKEQTTGRVMAGKHTQGVMSVSGVRHKIGKYTFHTLLAYDDKAKRDETVAEVYFDERTGLGFADAHRLRDCWNACEGIPNPSAIREVVEALRAVSLWLDGCLQCKHFVWDADQKECAEADLVAARAALAKLEGRS